MKTLIDKEMGWTIYSKREYQSINSNEFGKVSNTQRLKGLNWGLKAWIETLDYSVWNI